MIANATPLTAWTLPAWPTSEPSAVGAMALAAHPVVGWEWTDAHWHSPVCVVGGRARLVADVAVILPTGTWPTMAHLADVAQALRARSACEVQADVAMSAMASAGPGTHALADVPLGPWDSVEELTRFLDDDALTDFQCIGKFVDIDEKAGTYTVESGRGLPLGFAEEILMRTLGGPL